MLIILFIAGCILSIVTSRRIENIKEYALGKTQYSLPIMVGTIFATSISSYSTIGAIEKVIGLGIFFIITFLTKPIFFILMGKVLARGASKFKNCISVADVIEKMYGETAGIITATLAIVMSIGMISIQIFAITTILKFVGLDKSWHLTFASLFFILYSALGGMRVVSIVDLFKFLIFFTVLPILCINCLVVANGIDGIYTTLGSSYFSLNMAKHEWFSLISILLFNALPGMTPPIIQRSLMLRDKDSISKVFNISGLLTIPLFAMIALIGLCAKAKGLAPDNGALEILLTDKQPGLRGLVLLGLFTIVMATADSYLNTAGIILTRNILKKVNGSFESLRTVRISNLLIGTIAIPISLSGINIVDFFISINTFWIPAVLVPMFIGYYNLFPTNQTVFTVSILGGGLCSILGYFYMGSMGAFVTILGVFGSAAAVCLYGYIISAIRIDIRLNIKIQEWFFINNDKCMVFSLWSLLFHILGCITLFYTNLAYFFIFGTILSVVMLLAEHIIKNQVRLNILMALFWHVGWALVISCCVLAFLIVKSEVAFLSLYIISILATCYILSGFHNILVPLLLSSPVLFYWQNDATMLAYRGNGVYFINGSIFLCLISIILSWWLIEHKNMQLRKELAVFEKISQKYYIIASSIRNNNNFEKMLSAKNNAEKKFVSHMYLALRDLGPDNLIMIENKKMLPIKLPSKRTVSQICLRTLCLDLKKFILFDAAKSKIKFDISSTIEKVKLNICPHYLHQLLFSIVYNMIYLVNTGCKVDVVFDLVDNEFCVTLKYTGINFSKDDLIRFTRGRKFVNAFILTFNDIFNCLKEIDAACTIDKEKEGGMIKISKFVYENVVRL